MSKVKVEKIVPEPVPVQYVITVDEETAQVLRAFTGSGAVNGFEGAVKLRQMLNDALGQDDNGNYKEHKYTLEGRPFISQW